MKRGVLPPVQGVKYDPFDFSNESNNDKYKNTYQRVILKNPTTNDTNTDHKLPRESRTTESIMAERQAAINTQTDRNERWNRDFSEMNTHKNKLGTIRRLRELTPKQKARKIIQPRSKIVYTGIHAPEYNSSVDNGTGVVVVDNRSWDPRSHRIDEPPVSQVEVSPEILFETPTPESKVDEDKLTSDENLAVTKDNEIIKLTLLKLIYCFEALNSVLLFKPQNRRTKPHKKIHNIIYIFQLITERIDSCYKKLVTGELKNAPELEYKKPSKIPLEQKYISDITSYIDIVKTESKIKDVNINGNGDAKRQVEEFVAAVNQILTDPDDRYTEVKGYDAINDAFSSLLKNCDASEPAVLDKCMDESSTVALNNLYTDKMFLSPTVVDENPDSGREEETRRSFASPTNSAKQSINPNTTLTLNDYLVYYSKDDKDALINKFDIYGMPSSTEITKDNLEIVDSIIKDYINEKVENENNLPVIYPPPAPARKTQKEEEDDLYEFGGKRKTRKSKKSKPKKTRSRRQNAKRRTKKRRSRK